MRGDGDVEEPQSMIHCLVCHADDLKLDFQHVFVDAWELVCFLYLGPFLFIFSFISYVILCLLKGCLLNLIADDGTFGFYFWWKDGEKP